MRGRAGNCVPCFWISALGIALVICFPVLAGESAGFDDPGGRFESVPDCHAVVDRQTRLMWQRCSLGQEFLNGSCTGRPHRLEWDQAAMQKMALCGYSDWHLPERHDLEGLLIDGQMPAIDQSVFPNTVPAAYWTASSSNIHQQRAWCVNFGRGIADALFKDSRLYLRLVRELK